MICGLAFPLAFAVIMAFVGVGDVVLHLRRLSLPLLAGLLALSLLNYLARGIRWHYFARQRTIEIPFARNLLYYVAGFAVTVTPGKIGEILRLWLMRRGDGVAYERSASLLLADRLSDFGALVILLALGVAKFSSAWLTLTVAASAFLLVLLLIRRPGWCLRLIAWSYGRIGRWPRVFVLLRRFVRETSTLVSSGIFVTMLGLSTLGWLAEALALHWLLASFGYDIGVLQAIFVFAFAMLAGGTVMLPGGLGGTEAGMVLTLLGLGVPADVAVAATLIFRLTTLWFAVILGFLCLPAALRLANIMRASPAHARAV